MAASAPVGLDAARCLFGLLRTLYDAKTRLDLWWRLHVIQPGEPRRPRDTPCWKARSEGAL